MRHGTLSWECEPKWYVAKILGRLLKRDLCGTTERPDAPDLDFACWQATRHRYIKRGGADRRGIGYRIALVIRPETRWALLVKMLGTPDDSSADCRSVVHGLHTACFLMFDCNEYRKQAQVSVVGD
ncbi:MAG: hypothetical protein R6X19_03630 [Kiritimatiellia bacterium]